MSIETVTIILIIINFISKNKRQWNSVAIIPITKNE